MYELAGTGVSIIRCHKKNGIMIIVTVIIDDDDDDVDDGFCLTYEDLWGEV